MPWTLSNLYVKQNKLFFYALNTGVVQGKIIQPLIFWEIFYAMNNIYEKCRNLLKEY